MADDNNNDSPFSFQNEGDSPFSFQNDSPSAGSTFSGSGNGGSGREKKPKKPRRSRRRERAREKAADERPASEPVQAEPEKPPVFTATSTPKPEEEEQAPKVSAIAEADEVKAVETAGTSEPAAPAQKPMNEASLYAEAMRQREKSGGDKRSKAVWISLVIAIILVPVCTIMPVNMFNGSASLALFNQYVGQNITAFANWITGGPVTSGISIVFWQMLACAVIGAALSLNGCIYQGALRNALASPSTLGVVSGGTLGTLIYALTFGMPTTISTVTIVKASDLADQYANMDFGAYLMSTWGSALFSLIGCFVVVALILVISQIAGRGKTSKVALLIAGQVFTALITGVVSVIRTYLSYYGTVEQQEVMQEVIGGSITSIVDPVSFGVLTVPLIIGAVIILLMRNRLNALAFDENEAKTMGLSVTATRNLVIIICTILTGVVISFVGSIGFVGFIVPHVARKVVGPDFRYLVPASMTFGAVFLVFANFLMNFTGILQGALGTFTSIVGAIFFLVVIVYERKRGNVEWV